MLQMKELDKIAQSKLNDSVSEIYEMIKAGSADYKELEKNINEITFEIRVRNVKRGEYLRDSLINKMHEDAGNIKLNNRKILYLCDGEVPECDNTNCALKTSDGFCRHTSDINHAVNFKNFMENPGVAAKETECKTKIVLEGEKEYVEGLQRIREAYKWLQNEIEQLNRTLEITCKMMDVTDAKSGERSTTSNT